MDVNARTDSADRFGIDLALAKRGDPAAFARVFQPLQGHLWRIARERLPIAVRSHVDESDVVQDTLLKAYRGLADFRGDYESQLVAWLHGILKNRIKDIRRSHRRRMSSEAIRGSAVSLSRAPDLERQATAPTDLIAAAEQSDVIQRLLGELPEDSQTVIRLRAEEGLSFVEIGRLLGRSADSVRMAWVRAHERVIKALDEHNNRGNRQHTHFVRRACENAAASPSR